MFIDVVLYLCLCYTLCVDVSLPFASAQFVCSLWPTGDNPFSPQDFRSFRTSICILFDLKKAVIKMPNVSKQLSVFHSRSKETKLTCPALHSLFKI